VNLKTGLAVCQDHWKSQHSMVTMTSSGVDSEIFNVEKYRDLDIPVTGQSR